MLRAGWAVQLRAHGVFVKPDPLTANVTAKTRDGHELWTVLLEFATTPKLMIDRPRLPRFILAGKGQLPSPHAEGMPPGDEHGAPGCWLTVVGCEFFDIPAALQGDFERDPDQHLDAIEEVLGAAVRQRPRAVAEIVAGLIASQLKVAPFDLWNQQRVYWYTHDRMRGRFEGGTTLVIPRTDVSLDSVESLLRRVTPALKATGTDRNALLLAGRWYLRASGERLRSADRFLGFFQCIEALANMAPQEPEPTVIAALAKLDDLIQADPARDDLAAFLQRVRERLQRPVLAERFRRLGARLLPAEVEQDAPAFSAMNELRNQLLHARIAELPSEHRGYNVDKTVFELAQRYYNAACLEFEAVHGASLTFERRE